MGQATQRAAVMDVVAGLVGRSGRGIGLAGLGVADGRRAQGSQRVGRGYARSP